MTAFEQEVAAALDAYISAIVPPEAYAPILNVLGRDLAPRVAAAIKRTRWVTFNETWIKDWSGPIPSPAEEAAIEESALASALVVLRRTG